MYSRNVQGWVKHLDFLIVDMISLHLVLVLAYAIRNNAFLYGDPSYCKLSILMMFCDIFVYILFNTMHNVLKRGFYIEFRETFRHCLIVFALTMLFLYTMESTGSFSRMVLYLTLFFHIVFGYGLRLFWKWFIKNHWISVVKKNRLIVLLDPEKAERTMEQINRDPLGNNEIIGIILSRESEQITIDGVPVVAFIDKAATYICQNSVDSIYIDCLVTDPGVAELMEACVQMGVPIHYHVPAIFGERCKNFVEKIGEETVLTSSLNYATLGERIAKRSLDIIGGLCGSIIALFLILILGPIIKKASPGPILYSQERIGLNGRRFKMYKLRSMCMDADQKKKMLMDQNRVKDCRMFKMDNDPRVIGNVTLPDGTCKKGIGDFIRRTSLDEFPQFFNVLLGQMSLVGTRPPTVDEWETYEYHHRARLACKPGITGVWQVSGRSEINDFEEVVEMDTHYITHWYFGLDLRILLKTIVVVLAGQGAL